MSKLDAAEMLWQSEVDNETVRLIEKGVPPYQAKTRAVKVVSNRRRAEYADKSGG